MENVTAAILYGGRYMRLLSTIIACISIGGIFLTTSGAAANSITIDDAVRLAMGANGELSILRSERGLLEAGITKAGLYPNPIFEMEGTSGHTENSLAVGLSQELVTGGKRKKRLALAEIEMAIYQLRLADRIRMIQEEVKAAFYDFLFATRKIELVERSVALHRQLFEVAEARLAAGDISELEMNLVRVELARSEGMRIDIEKTARLNQVKLWTLIGLQAGEEPTVVDEPKPSVLLKITLEEFKRMARENRPDIKVSLAEVERGSADIIVAKADRTPNITAGLAFTRDTTENKNTEYAVGFKLAIPIPVFDKNQAGIHEALVRRTIAENRITAIVRNAEREVEAAYGLYINSEKILSLYRTNIIPQFEENMKLTMEAYQLGEVDVLTAIQEQKKFFEVNDGYLTALHDVQTALVKLETATATNISGGVQ